MDKKQIANEKTAIKIIKFNEKLWIVFAGISVVMTGYCIITGDRKWAWGFVIATFMCGFFYAFKKSIRKKREKYLEERMGTTK